ncbi:MAG TPA: hypothetical protein VN613_10065 [Gemmatimonadaceae bacterium]|nr:hypothetical protein [Gemmatimonadaceae bacterium]
MRFVTRLAAAAAAFCWSAAALGAQGSLGLQGYGYPGGELSTRALATGGALGDFDANSPINPAALMIGTRATVYLQYDPEFRWVTGPGFSASTVTARFPLFLISGKLGKARFSLSYSSFLDRSWTNTYQDTQVVGPARVPSTVTAISNGGIADVRGAMSYTFSDKLTLGVGVHVFPGQNQVIFGRSFPQDTTSFGAFSSTNTYNFSGSAVSFGLVATPLRHINIGLSGRHGFSMHEHQGDSTTLGDANVPDRGSVSFAYDGMSGTIISARYGFENWSAMKGLGSAGLTVFDATEFSAGIETGGPKFYSNTMPIRLGFRDRTLPFGVGPQQVRETEISAGAGLPLSQGRVALDLALAHAQRTANVGYGETGWIFSLGIAIKPY